MAKSSSLGNALHELADLVLEVFWLDPRIAEYPLSLDAVSRLFLQHLGDQILDPRMHISWKA